MTCQVMISRLSHKNGKMNCAYPALTPFLLAEEGPYVVVVTTSNVDGREVILDIWGNLLRLDEQDSEPRRNKQIGMENRVEGDIIPTQVQKPC